MREKSDQEKIVNFCLGGSSQISSERLFIILTIGLLNSLELELISIDEFHATIFNPRTLNYLKNLNVNPKIIELCHRSLFLEDIEQMFSSKTLSKNISELKEFASHILAKSEFNPKAENGWFVKL